MGTKRGAHVRYRSAVTGRFVSAAYAKRHPKTTLAERVKGKG